VFVDSNVILRHLGGDVRAKKIVDLVESEGYLRAIHCDKVVTG